MSLANNWECIMKKLIPIILITLVVGVFACASSEEIVFENDYVKLKQVEGLSYVFHENVLYNGESSYSIAIYNEDYLCGRFGVRNAPPKTGFKQNTEWQIFCSELSSHGSVEVVQYTVSGVSERYILQITEVPFTYGDTEWLINAGVFADTKEACQEHRKSQTVIWSEAGVDKGYYLYLNPLFISEKQMDKLLRSATFKEGAFAPEQVSEWLAAEGGVPSSAKYGEHIFVRENASRLTYRIEAGGRVYHMPEQTVALQVDEDDWDLYGYTSSGAVKIGTAHMDDELQISINNGVVLDEEDFEESDKK